MTNPERPRLTAVEGLARLPSPPPRPSVVESDSDLKVPEPPAAPRAPRAVQPRRAPAGADSILLPVTFSLPVSIRTKVRELAKSSVEMTVAQVILDAIENNLELLDGLVEAEKPRVSMGGGLFPHAAHAGRPLIDEERAPLTIRIAKGNLAVIEKLRLKTKADNRSQLVTAALRALFTHKPVRLPN